MNIPSSLDHGVSEKDGDANGDGGSTLAGAGRLALRSIGPNDSAVDRVTAEIRRAILSGALASGQSFSIAELGAELGVSHIPVREALRHLNAQGLVVMRPGRSAIVSPLSRVEFDSIYRLRQLIEPDLAARSCPLLTPADIETAERLLVEYSDNVDDADELWSCHHELHKTVIQPAASEWDLRVLAQLWYAGDRYTRMVFDIYAMDADEHGRRQAAHRTLLDAARSGSPEALRQAVSEHLESNRETCLARIVALADDGLSR